MRFHLQTPAQRVRSWLTVSAMVFVTANDSEFIRRVGPIDGQWYDLKRKDLEDILDRLDSMTLEAAATKKRLMDLQEDSDKFHALEAHGVDNWEGYEDAMQSLEGNEEEE